MVKTGRILTTALAVVSCTLTATCQAQGGSPAGEVVTLPAGASGHSYTSGAFGDAGPAPGAAYCPPPGGGYCPPQAVVEKPWWEKTPLFIHPGFVKPPRGAFVRLEYLLWEIEEPGGELLGAMPPAEAFDSVDRDFDEGYYSHALFDDNFDPSDGFATSQVVRNPVTNRPFNQAGFRYVPRMTELQLRDNSGIRGTIGIPTYEYGTIELSGWMLEQASDERRYLPRHFVPGNDFFSFFEGDRTIEDNPVIVRGDAFFPSTSVSINDGDDFVVIPYDHLDVAYRSDLWGADAKFVIDALAPDGEGFKIKPLIGFKYVGLQEAMYQRGVFTSRAGQTNISSINSDTTNTLLGGTIGIRGELEHRWFTVGVQPAVTFAGNIAEASVTSDRLLGNQGPPHKVSSEYFDFAPILEINTYARINLGDNCRFLVGYDAMWLSRVFRASRAVDYRVTREGQSISSDIDTSNTTDHVAVEGLSLGLEYTF